MKNILIAIPVFVLFCAGVIWLQVFLSKLENKWLGLILPVIKFIFSLLAVMSIAVFNTYKTTTQVIDEYGHVINKVIENTRYSSGDIISTILMVIMVFLMYNIPTLILLAIYWGCREKLRRNKELDKMNIQDLE